MTILIPETVTGFGLTIKKLDYSELPLLCQKRNHGNILPYMDDTRQVPLSVLEFWFKKSQTYKSIFPFLVFHDKNPIAYLDLKNIDYKQKSCEDGIFLFDNAIPGQNLGSRIYLCREKLLRALNIIDVFSLIRPDNVVSINFFKKIGASFFSQKNGLLVFKQPFKNRMKALRLRAEKLALLEEFNMTFLDYDLP